LEGDDLQIEMQPKIMSLPYIHLKMWRFNFATRDSCITFYPTYYSTCMRRYL